MRSEVQERTVAVPVVMGRKSALLAAETWPHFVLMLKLVVLVALLLSAVGCSYVQMQPKGNDAPPAPAAPRLP